jgi:ubiquinone/menaquinone biosynthesis C-methylase UbiE
MTVVHAQASSSESRPQKPLRSEAEIQAAYSAPETASEYIDRRFVSPMMEVMHDAQVRAVNEALAKRRPVRALEIAPGPGRITRHVRLEGMLTCLEYNSAMIEEGQRACSRHVRWRQGNAFEMDICEQFDCVYTFRFVRHFELSDRRRLYDKVASVLSPGGTFLMDAVNKHVSLPLRESRPRDYPVYDKLYDNVDEIRQELASHELVLQSARPVLRWFRTQSVLQNLLGPRCDSVCRRLIRSLERIPSGSPLEWIILCRRA